MHSDTFARKLNNILKKNPKPILEITPYKRMNPTGGIHRGVFCDKVLSEGVIKSIVIIKSSDGGNPFGIAVEKIKIIREIREKKKKKGL